MARYPQIKEIAPDVYEFKLSGKLWIVPKPINLKINLPIMSGCYLTLDGRLGTVDWINDWDQQAIKDTVKCLDDNFKRKQ